MIILEQTLCFLNFSWLAWSYWKYQTDFGCTMYEESFRVSRNQNMKNVTFLQIVSIWVQPDE